MQNPSPSQCKTQVLTRSVGNGAHMMKWMMELGKILGGKVERIIE